MAFKVTISVLSESQEGDIGDDWKFDLSAKVFNEGLKGEGRIKVKKHNLPAGVVQDPPGPPEPLELPGGDADGEILVRLSLTATEVDLFQNDSGTVETDLKCPCPTEEDRITAHQTEMSVGVRESPGFLNQVAVFTLKLRIVIERI
ncbi:hypothetical protein [Elongatibacter sediminis]|uniref:Uncharacterized protein n=1 Tax=Elongatibacter sediminis TaxID=3119006 RepID=A0AAW9RAZ0_9GAMM